MSVIELTDMNTGETTVHASNRRVHYVGKPGKSDSPGKSENKGSDKNKGNGKGNGGKKSMKGRTTIELKDVKTGKVTVHKEENMLTNMYARLWTPFGDGHSFGNYCALNDLEFWDKAVGGVMLFAQNLDENQDLTMAPSSVECVGSAGTATNNGLNAMVGSYNLNESERTEKSIKKVWDFATDQANGTIGCICLTSDNGGHIGQGCVTCDADLVADYRAGTSVNGIAVDVTYPQATLAYAGNNMAYFFDYYNLVYNSSYAETYARTDKKLRLKRVFVPIEGYSLAVQVKNPVAEEIEIDIPAELANVLSTGTTALYGSISYDEGNIYLFLNNSASVAAGATFYVIKIAVSDIGLSASLITLTNTTGVSFAVSAFSNRYTHYQYVDNTHFYTFGSDKKVYRMSLENPTDVMELKDPEGNEVTFSAGGYYRFVFTAPQAGYLRIVEQYTSSTSTRPRNQRLINKSTGVLWYEEISADNLGHYGDTFPRLLPYMGNDAIGLYMSTNGIFPFIRPNYLFTINNVTPLITKTASQIMKITYTLTEE